MESEIKIKLTNLGWAGISLIAAGVALTWIGAAVIDWNTAIANQWWDLGNVALRTGVLVAVVGIFTRLAGKWLTFEVKPQRKIEAQRKGA